MTNPYSVPSSVLNDPEQESAALAFFPTAQNKLLVLYFATFGAYPIYWFYKHWSLHKEKTGEKILPAMRSIFFIFYTHALFKNIEAALAGKDGTKSINATALSTVFVVLTLVTNFLNLLPTNSDDRYGVAQYAGILIMFAMAWPLYVIQSAANRANNDPEGALNCAYSAYNILFIIAGVIFWLLFLIGVIQLETAYFDNMK